jgi:hypothetical protein
MCRMVPPGVGGPVRPGLGRVVLVGSGPGTVLAGQTGLSETMQGEAQALVGRNQDEVAESVAGVGPGVQFAC